MAVSAGYGDAGIRLPDGLASFLQGIDGDLQAFDAAGLEDLLERQLMLPGLGHDRTYPQAPGEPPQPGGTPRPRRSTARWSASSAPWPSGSARKDGRSRQRRRPRGPADARDLMAVLGTGDEGLKFHSKAKLA